jgi:hypothetical protein
MASIYRYKNDLVTIGGYLGPTEVQIAKGMLEAAGIECVLQGENANNMLAMAFRARLRVRRVDFEAACELLNGSDEVPRDWMGSFDA